RRTRINTRGEKTVVHIAGWTDASGSRVVCAVLDDGRVEVASSFDEHHPYLYSIEFMPEEK
ncbi:MAG: hypothetical protein Q7T18_08920, partial [Sedimentisphaerales bacterium]|nr:hypothetical protein [Sedimentisphaerales bacterium]